MIGPVAFVGIVPQPVIAKPGPGGEGGRLAGRGQYQAARQVGIGRDGIAGSAARPLERIGVRAGRGAPAVPQPGPVERRVDLVRRAVVLDDAPGGDRVGRTGAHQRHLAERGRDPFIARGTVGREVGADVHRRPRAPGAGADLAGDGWYDRDRVAAAHDQLPTELAQLAIEIAQAPVEERGAGRPRRAQQGVVEDEQRRHRPIGRRGIEGRVIAQAQISAKPEHTHES